MQLSDNFTLLEATKSQTATRLGIDNTPDELAIERMETTAQELLQPVRGHFGIPFSPSSWFRGEPLERAICWGGDDVKSSFARWCARHGQPVNEESWKAYFAKKQHPTGEAVDFEVPGVSNMQVALWMARNLDYDQIILEFWRPDNPNAGWIHGSYRSPKENRKEFLRFDGRVYATLTP